MQTEILAKTPTLDMICSHGSFTSGHTSNGHRHGPGVAAECMPPAPSEVALLHLQRRAHLPHVVLLVLGFHRHDLA
jgi:hypothetical protein